MTLRKSIVFIALLGASLFLVAPASANAATVQPHAVVSGGSCPDYHNGGAYAICFYDSQNFKNFLGSFTGATCSGAYVFSDVFRNRIESVRNRTGCGVHLLYYSGSALVYTEYMAPYSEDGTISPLNAIDGFALL